MKTVDLAVPDAIPSILTGLPDSLDKLVPIKVGLLLCCVVDEAFNLTIESGVSGRRKLDSGLRAIAILSLLRDTPETPEEVRDLIDSWYPAIAELTKQEFEQVGRVR